MGRRKILFVAYRLGGGGAPRTLLNIVNHLDRERFTPVVVTLNHHGSYEPELKADIKLIKLPTKKMRQAALPLARTIREERPDLVFSTHFPELNVLAILARLLSFTGAESIVREADHFGGQFLFDLKLRGIGLVYRFARQIVALSHGVRQNLIERYGLPPERIRVIYNPVDLDAIAAKVKEESLPRQHHGLFQTEEKVILTAGRLVAQKDHATLLRAFAQVRAQIPSRLIILGEGPLREALLAQAAELGLAQHVHLLGFQANPYIYFQQADLFVLSSVHEGFSHVLVEALATGTPVVSTDCPSGPAEVLDQGRYGALCPVGDADQMARKMLEVLSLAEEERRQLVESGRRRAQDFAAAHIVPQYEQLFLEALEHGVRRVRGVTE